MSNVQPGILAPVPPLARYLTFTLGFDAEPGEALARLAVAVDGGETVVGIGLTTVVGMGRAVPGLRAFPGHVGEDFEVPATPSSLWCWLRGDDRGDLVHRTRHLRQLLAPAFSLDGAIDAFKYGTGLDLTGYEDGTENPTGEDAEQAAIVHDSAAGLNGSSFVAVQQWVHDMDRFQSMTAQEQDNAIGRRKSDNAEIEDAPAGAHVKRTAQESFEPQAFVLRRSMPWADETQMGLVFVAFGRSFDAFEAQLSRMQGSEDGITDALFDFTQPVSGSYYWCPPVADGRLDLSAILG